MVIVGIDPGLKGGVTFLRYGNGNNTDCFLMPVTVEDGISASQFYNWLCCYSGEMIAYVEHAQAMPKQGVVSVFNYGVGFGKILAALEIRGIEIKLVRPGIWKKALNLPKEKEAAVARAESLEPRIEFRTPRGRLLDGKAEAFLIAFYGMMKERNAL